MGFNAVADQFRKWRRSSHQRDINETTLYQQQLQQQYGEQHTVDITKLNINNNNTSAVVVDPSINKPKKLRNPPAKQYPPSPDTYLNGIGDYTFIRQVGQGKFSKVMLSYHCLTRKQVAVKIIDKRVHDYRVMSRLVREISLMEVLDHPNIVRLYETYETTDSLYLVMEYVDGFNLDEYLQQKGGRLPEKEARDIFRQMAAAMDYCHSRWVVHRDLKAPNILLTKDFKVKIADFGLGNRFGRRRLKTICGSMLYYSPEIINGQGYTGPEVDCWCLGVSLFRMTVGEEPFSRANTVGDLRKVVTAGQYTVPSYLSPELKNTIKKCMSVDQNKRTRVHIALKDDPWLTENGTLPHLFTHSNNSTTTVMSAVISPKDDEITRSKKEKERLKYQHMRDMEEEKRSKKFIKRTIICHPKNPSIYFTSAVPHSSKPEDKYTNSETQRHMLFQKVNEISHQILLSSTQNAAGKSPIRHLLRKLKQPENGSIIVNNGNNTNSLPMGTPTTATTTATTISTTSSGAPARTIVRKSASNMSLSQLYQRVTKDQVHYYTFQLTPPTVMRLLGAGESSMFVHPTQQDEFTMMLIIRGICDIMGITYHRDKNDHLICVMALSDYINEKPKSFYKLKRRDSKMTNSNQSLSTHMGTNDASGGGNTGSQASFNLGQSDMNRSSYFGTGSTSRFSKFKRMTSNVLSSMFPYHSSTLVIQDSRSMMKYPPFPTLNTRTSQSSHNSQSPLDANNDSEQSDENKKKSGVAIFAIEIISLTKESTANRITAIKLSKIEGSSKVFRIACGWLTGVIGQNITPAQLSDNLNTLTATIQNSHTDIPSMVNQQQQQQQQQQQPIITTKQRITRQKSVMSLLSVQPTTPANTFPPSTIYNNVEPPLPPHPLDSPPSSSGQFDKTI